MSGVSRLGATLAVGGLAVLASACARGGGGLGALPDGLAPSQLNLVVVTLDTTRADRIGAFARLRGTSSPETPNLDALAARGSIFANAISVTPLTLPAHCSIFTGLPPSLHGVRDNGGFRLAPEHVTLARLLHERGWRTGGFIGAFVLDHRWGISQGFERYYDDFDLSKYKTVSMGEIQRRGDDVVAHALDWISGVARERFFAWVHLYDPHAPYDPPEPYRSRYPGHPYDGEIAWTDHLVGDLLAGLDRLGLRERTIVVVVGDHGESLGEHGEAGHGYFVYEASIHVPLIVAGPYPALAGRKISAVARQIDLAPTLAELLGVREGLERGPGESLVPWLAGSKAPRSPAYSESFYARYHYGWAELRSMRTDRWHFIEAPRPELYDVAADPDETRNLAESERRTVVELRTALAEFDRASGPAATASAPVEEDEETMRKLAALGYIGTPRTDATKSFRDLPDPKDKVELYDRIGRARELARADDPAPAIPELERVLADDPGVVDAWFTLGHVRYRLRDWKGAENDFRETLSRRPDHDWAMVGLADTMVAEGRIDDAVLGYRRFLERDPKNAQIHYRLAQVLLDAGKNDEAAPEFERTLVIEPKTAQAEVGRAVVAFRKKDPAGAFAALDRALAIDPAARWARYNRALVLEDQGKVAAAAAAYREEIEAHGDNYKAAFNLGRLLATTGDATGATEAFAKAVEAKSDFAAGRFFYAQALLAKGDLDGAQREARAGLAIDGKSRIAALGHYVLADVASRRGRADEAEREARLGHALERSR